MSIFADIKSIRSGAKRAAADIARVLLFEEQHQELHAADPDYDCHPASKAFYNSLTQPERMDDYIEKASYLRDVKEFYDARRRESAANFEFPSIEGMEFVAIEFDPNDTPETMMEKARRAVEEAAAFKAVVADPVSETDQTTSQSNPNPNANEEEK